MNGIAISLELLEHLEICVQEELTAMEAESPFDGQHHEIAFLRDLLERVEETKLDTMEKEA